MTLETTPNQFGGDSSSDYTPPTPEERGDFVVEPTEEKSSADETDTVDATDTPDTDTDADAPSDDGETPSDETEGETDGETDDESDADNGESDDPNTHKVPRARLNKEALKRKQAEDKAKALQAQLDELMQAKETPEEDNTPKVAEPELSVEDFKKLQEAMLDEDTEGAFEAFKKMLATTANKQENLSADELREQLKQDLRVERENEIMAAKAKEISKAYHELDAENPAADPDMISEVVGLRNYYIDQGMNFADALNDAATMIAKKYELEDRSKPATITAPPKKEIDAAKKLKAAQQEQGKLPGDSSKTVNETPDIRKMSDAEFNALSEEARRRARGDFI